MHTRNSRQRSQLVVHTLIIWATSDYYPKEVIYVTPHKVTLHNLRNRADSFLETGQPFLLLAFQRDGYKDVTRLTSRGLIEDHRVAIHKARILKVFDSPQGRRFGEPYPSGKLYVG